MAQKSPNSLDVMDIQFKLHGRKNIFSCGGIISDNTNLLAVSSTYGLLFAGDPNKPELKVFMVKNLVDGETTGSDILVRTVPLSNVPNILACSCDGSMLAVNYLQNGSSFLQIFNTASFLTVNVISNYKIPLSPDNNAICLQILWNPVIAGNVAVILKTGALTIYTLKDSGQYEMHNLDKSQQIQCGCWSPKGKQIVLGFVNGKLQQFKPDLTPAKTIMCPPGIHNGPFSTIAVHWLSTFQFAVAFLQDGEGNIPSLYIVNAPKGGSPNYINYFDVCYTTGQRSHQMTFTHIQQWNLLLVTSANGIEVGLLGCGDGANDTPTWVQYTLLDEARIEMPLTDSKDETFPIGFGFDTSSTHRLIVDDKELPAMPMVHVLSTNGQLLSFNFLNLRQNAVEICSPPPPTSYSAQHFQPLSEIFKVETNIASNTATVQQPTAMVAATPPNLVASTPVAKEKAPPSFVPSSVQQSFEQLSASGGVTISSANTAANITSAKPIVSASFGGFTESNAIGLSFAGLRDQQNTNQPTTQVKPQFQQQMQQQEKQQQQKKSQQQSTLVVGGNNCSELNKPLYMVPPNFTPSTSTTTATVETTQPRKTQINIISNEMQKGFLELIAVQINSFDKEIKQSGNSSKGLLKNIGSPDEMRVCTKRLNDLHEIVDQANDHEFEMDVQNLRHSLNEARAMIAECRWKFDKYNNPDLPRLGNNTSDPANRRQLAKLQSYVTANEAQIQLLKYLIDAQWSNFQDVVHRNTKSQIHIPCLDGVYQRMSKMQETLMRQRNKINNIKAKLQQNGLLHKMINNGKSFLLNGKSEITIDSLADSILSMTLAPVVDDSRSKLSQEKLNAIREFTRQRKTVNIIKAQRPNRVGLNSEVVLETMLQSERSKMREALNASIAEEQKKEIKATIAKEPLLPKPTATKSLVSSAQSPFVLGSIGATTSNFSFGNANSFTKALSTTASQDLKTNNQQPQVTLSFKAPPVLSGFGATNTITTIQTKSNIESVKIGGPTTPENESPGIQQAPISFAAKVVGGTSANNKNNVISSGFPGIMGNATNVTQTTSTSGDINKSFSFVPATSTSIFSGVGTANTLASIASKPAFDAKNTTSFSFSGFAANNATNTFASSTALTSTSSTTKPAVPSIFSGFGKPIGAENMQSAASVNQVETVTSSNKPTTINETLSIAPTMTTTTSASNLNSSLAPVSATLSSTADSSTTSEPTEVLLEDLSICKPTTKTSEPAKSATNLFAGLGASTGSSFSFTPVTGNISFSFADLTKTLATTVASQPTTTTSTTTTATITAKEEKVEKNNVTPSAIVSTSKPAELNSSLNVLNTSTAPSISSAAATSASNTTTSIFGSAGLIAKTVGTTLTTASTASAPVFGASNTGLFSSVSMPAATTAAAPVSSGGSLFASVTPAANSTTSLTSTFGSFSVGSTADATNASRSGNIFGNIPKPDQSVFANASATATSPQAPSAGLFAAAAQNVSPFSAATISPPPNQTVATGGGIFGGGSSFVKPATAGSIFGGGATASFGTAAATVPTNGGSIFAGAAVKPAESSGGIFSAAAQQANTTAASGGSIFGQSSFGTAATTQSSTVGLFANAAQTQSAFGASSASPFGAVANTSGVSGGSLFGGSTGFGSFSQPNTGSPFSSPSTANISPFGQSGASVAQSGFGSPTQQNSAFNRPIFGGPATFGSPPAFGSQPTFGGAATFGSFAAPAATSPTSAGFGAQGQQSNLFEALGSSDTGLSFGNLAQGANANAPKPTFGGSSFTSYRS